MSDQRGLGLLWRNHDVWRRQEAVAIRYRCFENLLTGLFYVQSADFYRMPIDPAILRQHDHQFVELLFEEHRT